eukprot:m.30467 g.30467  ORF g.30467 m.30467 type:complete len:465 (-) comp4782_c0_seq1:401-1795(-)
MRYPTLSLFGLVMSLVGVVVFVSLSINRLELRLLERIGHSPDPVYDLFELSSEPPPPVDALRPAPRGIARHAPMRQGLAAQLRSVDDATQPLGQAADENQAAESCRLGARTFTHFSCDGLRPRARASPEDRVLLHAMRLLCSARYRALFNVQVPCEFAPAYYSLYNSTGWGNEAYVTFVSSSQQSLNLDLADGLIQTVHEFSKRHILVLCVDTRCEWNPRLYPRLIVMHAQSTAAAQPLPPESWRWLAMITARIRTGVQLDTSMMLLPGADVLFERTRVHITARYPFFVLPMHWMSRDPRAGDYPMYAFIPPAPINRTMRWGHAHPTWTYHALGMITELYYRVLSGEFSGYQDEDVANMISWEKGLTKQWCPWETSHALLGEYLQQGASTALKGPLFQDPLYHPHGVPLLFAALHDCKERRKTVSDMNRILSTARAQLLQPIVYQGAWYDTPSQLSSTSYTCVL